jgi:hypothetical protein
MAEAAARSSERLLVALDDPVDAASHRNGQRVGNGVALLGVTALLGLTLISAPALLHIEEGDYSLSDRHWATDTLGLLKGPLMENRVFIADFLNKTMPAGATLAYLDIGVTSYLTPQLKYLDTYGLTDRAVARLSPLSKGYVGPPSDYTDAYTDIGQHLRERRPDYILAWRPAATRPQPILGGDYVPAMQCPLRADPGRLPDFLQVWKRAE